MFGERRGCEKDRGFAGTAADTAGGGGMKTGARGEVMRIRAARMRKGSGSARGNGGNGRIRRKKNSDAKEPEAETDTETSELAE